MQIVFYNIVIYIYFYYTNFDSQSLKYHIILTYLIFVAQLESLNADAVACSHSGQELTVLSKYLQFNQNSAFRLKWYHLNVGAVACFHSD